MPRQATIAETSFTNLVVYLNHGVTLLNELHDTFGTPFCPAISATTLSLINGVQKAKRNRLQCLELITDVPELIYAIVKLHLQSEIGPLPPAILQQMGKFTETLLKIHTFVEMQQDGNKLKQLFQQSERNRLFKDCREGLDLALEAFKISTATAAWNDIAEIQKKAEQMHQDLLEFISNLTDGPTSDLSSSIYQMNFGSENSSNSFSLLPPYPKIFYGREGDLTEILQTLAQPSARVIILGAGGIGKTSLARAVLHHSEITVKFEHRFFVTADSATTSTELTGLIGLHLKLKPGKNMTRQVVEYFRSAPPCFLVLDNLETSWEPMESRAGVEEFLSLLADLPQLTWLATMRGAERPAKVRWTRPFLPPLKPLSDSAARETFLAIADGSHKLEEIDRILQLTDNMPLAVSLIANLVDHEGCSNILARWEAEKTLLLSAGNDRRSSLNASIQISLSSPRMISLPGAQDLLSLLSILPDGLSEVELGQIHLPIKDVLHCKAILLATSLAYLDNQKRLKSLVPIREYIQQTCPPTRSAIQPLRKYFHLLLELYQKYRGAHQVVDTVSQISLNLGNIQQILRNGLQSEHTDLPDTIICTLFFNQFSRTTGHGYCPLMDQIQVVIPEISNNRVKVQFITELFLSSTYHRIPNTDLIITEARVHFREINDPVLESNFYFAAGSYAAYSSVDIPESLKLLNLSLRLGQLSGDVLQQSRTLNAMGDIEWWAGDYPLAQQHSLESQRLAKLCGNLYEEAKSVSNQAACHLKLGNYPRCLISLHQG
ncbi:hypothetical protein B0H16DRAFT_1784805, partial [Mycena metata]